MHKLLIIDYLSPKGHENFDAIHINALLRLGYSITAIGKKGQFDKVDNHPNFNVINLPSWCNVPIKINQSLFIRLQGIFTLIYIMIKYKQKYDYSILLCYDILSCFIYRTKAKIILVNHNNVEQLGNVIKYELTKNYNNYLHICLNTHIKDYMKLILPKKYIRHVPHGLVSKFTQLSEPYFIKAKSHSNILFCPVNRNFNICKVASIFNDEKFLNFLSENNILLVVKKNDDLRQDNSNMLLVEQRISDEEYGYLIRESLAVILPYTEEFKYRCSGIFFECVANDTTIIAFDNPSVNIYSNQTDMYIFYDADTLIESIRCRLEKGKRYRNKQMLDPISYWRDILK